MEETGRIGLEIGVDTEQSLVVMRVSDIEAQNEIQLALTQEQAYSMAVGLMSALRSLRHPDAPQSPLAGGGGETLH